MKEKQVSELLLQSLEHEIGGVLVYEAALKCVVNENLRAEWERYLDETRNHVGVLADACVAVGLDPDRSTPGRRIVQELGWALIAAMEKASVDGPSEGAQLVACECVVMVETKDHLDWELIGKCADKFRGEKSLVLKDAFNEIEDQGDEHLYHSRVWCRELWIESLGMRVVLPPPDESQYVKAANGTVRDEHAGRNTVD
jgi:rubrerythrin